MTVRQIQETDLARLEKFSGAEALPGTRQPQVIADTVVGEATEKFGRQIQQSAGAVADLGRLLQRHRDRVAELESQRSAQDIDVSLKLKEDEARKNPEPGALNLAQNMLSHFDKVSEQLLKEKPKPVRERVEKVLADRRPEVASRYAKLEYNENQSYFRTEVANLYHGLISGVRNAPETFQKAAASMEALISETPLPGAEKRKILASGVNALREAWFKTLPPAERLRYFTELELRAKNGEAIEAGGFTAAAGHEGIANSSKTPRGEQKSVSEEFLHRLAELPARTRDRLSAETREEMALVSVSEGERVAERIATDHRTLDPLEIQDNPKLRGGQRTALLSLLDRKYQEDSLGLEALNWIHSHQAANPFSSEDRDQAAVAYNHLTSYGADPDITARDILLSQEQVAPAFAYDLQKRLRSGDSAEVKIGFESLAGLHTINSAAISAAPRGHFMADAVTRWRVLTELRGETGLGAAEKIAEANKQERRSQLAQTVIARRHETRLKRTPGAILALLSRGRGGFLQGNRRPSIET